MNHLQYLKKEKEEIENTIHDLKIQKELQKGNNLPIEIVIGGFILIIIGVPYNLLGFTIISIYVGTKGINHIKIKTLEKEIDGFRYVKIGINKEIRKELEKETRESKEKLSPLKMEEKLDLYYDCGANIKLLNQKKFLYELKEKYCSMNPEEIEECVYTLVRKKEK